MEVVDEKWRLKMDVKGWRWGKIEVVDEEKLEVGDWR